MPVVTIQAPYRPEQGVANHRLTGVVTGNVYLSDGLGRVTVDALDVPNALTRGYVFASVSSGGGGGGGGGGGLGLEVEPDTPFPSALFVNSDGSIKNGEWWNPAVASSVFQDTAGTVPAAANDPVGRINGLSGSNNNLLFSGSKPKLQTDGTHWWLLFNGVSDSLMAVFPLVIPFMRVTAARQVTWVDQHRLWDGFTVNQGAVIQFTTSPQIVMFAGGGPNIGSSQMGVGGDYVLVEMWNGPASTLMVNHNLPIPISPPNSVLATSPGGAAIAVANGFGLNGNIRWYGSIHIQSILSPSTIAQCQTFFGNLAGLSL